MNNTFIENKKYFSNNLRELLRLKNITQKDLIELLKEKGIEKSQSTISSWIAKETKNIKVPTSDVIDILCEILQCDRSQLIYVIQSKPHPSFLEVTKKKFPVLGEVAAGKPIFMNEDRDCFVMADAEINADYCLIARGDSMTGLGIKNGDLVFIKSQDIVRNEEIAVVAIDEEATLKRFFYDKLNNKITLKSENPKYDDMVYQGDQLDHIKVLGKAVFYQSMIH